MRQEPSNVFGEDLRILTIRTRNRLDITQKEMGELLYMSESSYSDIETGKSHCSMATAILLLEMQKEPKQFLQNTVSKATGRKAKELQPI